MRLFVVCAMLILAAVTAAQDIQNSVVHSWQWFNRGGESLRIPCVKSHPLDEQHPGITRIVVCIHGTLRNANEYHPALIAALDLADDQRDSTLVITPQFLTDADTEHHDLADVLCWEYYGWRRGDASVPGHGGARPWDISSFAVVDSLFLRAANVCPDLREIVLTGHSAGGQTVNRWSASSRVPDLLHVTRGVRYRGVVMNPSSYVYFSPERCAPGSENVFMAPTPAQIAACPTYDHYKYGLADPNSYFAHPPDSLRARYGRRHVVHLAGELDCDPADDYLDITCPAQWQGTQRLERCRIYWNYLQWYFGAGLHPRQSMAVVPGVEHDFHAMFTSPCGVYHLFDVGQCGDGPNTVVDLQAVRLGDPYPNPFNPLVTVPLTLDRARHVTVAVYDLRGRCLKTLVSGRLAAGRHVLRWDGTDTMARHLPSGAYVVRTTVAGNSARAGLVLIR